MKQLREAILSQGVGLGKDVVKVDMFLNHRLDTALMTQIGQAFHEAFKDEPIDLILTIESSGIAAAFATAQAFDNIPVVFAKKGRANTMSEDCYQSEVFSFTHGIANPIRVGKQYLPAGSNVLIIDDFLANGEACQGLIEIVRQASGRVRGIGICIEKGFQLGGKRLRGKGYKVVSLATVKAIEDGKIILEPDVEKE